MIELIEKDSPFQPDTPVSPENFKGRTDIIQNISRYMTSSRHGRAKHFFLIGKRGMGKTSIGRYIIKIYEKKYNTIGIHVVNDGIHDLDSLITKLVEETLNKIESETWADKIIKSFKNNIKSVGFLDTKIEFKPQPETIRVLRDNLPNFLINITNKSQKHLIIMIDDINGLTNTPQFANWYKSFADTLSTNDFEGKIPISFILTGYPDKLTKLYHYNPSVIRIFHQYELEELKSNETTGFFKDMFKKVNIEYNDKAIEKMVYYSRGMPMLMQEIGDAIYWLLKNENKITEKRAIEGIKEAGKRIEKKYLKSELNRKTNGTTYKCIFKKIGKFIEENNKETFTKKELNNYLTKNEEIIFNNFLKKAKELKLIELISSKKQGEYKFTNNIYVSYCLIQNIE